MKRSLILLSLLFALAGCAKVSHLQELLTIKAISDERDGQAALVEQQNARFDALLEAVRKDQIGQYTRKKEFRKMFGDPVLARTVTRDGREVEQWLYRYATKYFDGDKVYLYFDGRGNLVEWEHVVPKEGSDGEKT